jgi:hypothetical protein
MQCPVLEWVVSLLEKGRLHDAAGYYEAYLKKETNEEGRARVLKKMYGLGQRAESKRAFAVAAELYGLVMVFADEEDPLRSKARASAVRSLETLESSMKLEEVR